ncbi:MAG: hypothetical protein ABR899_07395 [Candidatus Krumholzibacteriaceae bacterium]
MSRTSDFRRSLILRIGFERLVEIFLVSAVVSVLCIRAALSITGYPQIGGGGLHVAHVLFGGLGMAIALVLMMVSLTEPAINLAAVIGGVGFGAFIDEIGKFLTSDNDYFYRPAVAVMYMTFVAIYIAVRSIERRARPSQGTYLANVLDLTKEAVAGNLDEEEARRAREYLARCDQGDPVVVSIGTVLDRIGSAPLHAPGLIARNKNRMRSLYRGVMQQRWFTTLVVSVFVGTGLVAFVQGIVVLAGKRRSELSFAGWGELVSDLAVGVFIVLGLIRMRGSRLAAYRMFARAVLVSIFLAQMFAFYRIQFWAIAGLAAVVLFWRILQYMIGEEEARLHGGGRAGGRPLG